jgi:methyl-accepting chemotaxis protein
LNEETDLKQTTGMTIIKKVFILLLSVLALPLMLSVTSSLLLIQNSFRFEKTLSEELTVYNACQDMQKEALIMRMSLREYIATLNRWDERYVYKADFEKSAKKIRKNAELLKKELPRVAYGETSLPALNEAMAEFELYYSSVMETFPVMEAWTTIDYEAANGMVNDFKDHIYNFEVPVSGLAVKSRESLDARVAQLSMTGKIFSLAVLALLAVSLVFSLVFTLIFLTRLKKDLNTIILQVGEIAAGEGDLTREIRIRQKDEMGILAGHVNSFIGSLRSLVVRIKEITDRSLSLSSDLADISVKSAGSLETIRDRSRGISRSADDLDRDLESMVGIFEKVGAFSMNLDMMIDTQAASINESSAAIEEMSASIATISKSTDSRSQQALALKKMAGDGASRMNQTITGINKISESAQMIMEMLAVIDGIASQTNLLAMNAAIEAAHAGEAGRGFSVVAEEIRKLSEETAENSGTINRKLKEISDQIRESSKASRETGEHFRVIVEEVGIMTDSFTDMNQTMGEMSGGTRQVTEALAELVRESEDIRRSSNEIRTEIGGLGSALKNISTLSGGTRSGMESISGEIQSLFQSLERLSEAGKTNTVEIRKLEELVNRFRTDPEAQSGIS